MGFPITLRCHQLPSQTHGQCQIHEEPALQGTDPLPPPNPDDTTGALGRQHAQEKEHGLGLTF